MTIRQILATSIVAVTLVSTTSLHAASTSISTPIHAAFAKSATVKISFRNETPSQVELKIGDDLMKVDAGKTVSLRLAVGTRVLANTATPTLTAGALIIEVASSLNGATLLIH